MERQKEAHGTKMSVPQFGGWESMDPGAANYSVIFTKARANKKQQKSDIKPLSFGNERELMAAAASAHPQQDDSVVFDFPREEAMDLALKRQL